MLHRFIAAGTILALVVGWWSFVARSQGSAEGETPRQIGAAQPRERPFQLLGAGSCAGSACHNGSDTSTTKGREYALCVTDRHDRAYAVLLENRSKKIEQFYHGLADWKSARPERDLLCLKCHVHPDVDTAPMKEIDGVRQFRFEDGISCEACHGPAQRWLDMHHRPEWKSLSADDKRTHFGMANTRGLTSRAQSCVDCHVGNAAKGMDVNHDLIAAGHPRLAFEFSGYHSLMTKHWDDGRDRDPAQGGNLDFEALAWMKGQAVSLKASLELLRHRARAKPLLDFAEFDCFACHHDLSTKQNLSIAGAKAGQLSWNPWAASQAANALELLAGKRDRELGRGLKAIGAEVTKLNPDVATLNREIPEMVRRLNRALAESEKSPPAVPIRNAMERIAKNTPKTWDDAAQAYVGLIAWEKTRMDRRQPEFAELRPNLGLLRHRLLSDSRFRPNADETFDRILRNFKFEQ